MRCAANNSQGLSCLGVEFQALNRTRGIPRKVSRGAAIFGIIGQVGAQDAIALVIGDNSAGIKQGGAIVRQSYPIPLIGTYGTFGEMQETLRSQKDAIAMVT